MSLVANANVSPGETRSMQNKSLFIWLDILGFSDAVESEESYKYLSDLLKKFQNLFNESDKYDTRIISDGIVLHVKNITPSYIREVFRDIAKKQFKFVLENRYFIRGGIALGSKFEGGENDIFVSNGLARAVKLESSVVDWPIIGTDEKNIEQLREHHSIENDMECFGLQRGYNKNGKTIYFIDFISENQDYLGLLYNKLIEFKEDRYQTIKNKYIWLLRYYLYKFVIDELDGSVKGIVL